MCYKVWPWATLNQRRCGSLCKCSQRVPTVVIKQIIKFHGPLVHYILFSTTVSLTWRNYFVFVSPNNLFTILQCISGIKYHAHTQRMYILAAERSKKSHEPLSCFFDRNQLQYQSQTQLCNLHRHVIGEFVPGTSYLGGGSNTWEALYWYFP